MNRIIVPAVALAASFAGVGFAFAAVHQIHSVDPPATYRWPDLPHDETVYQGPDSTACRIRGDQGVRSGLWVDYVCELTKDSTPTTYGQWRLHAAA